MAREVRFIHAADVHLGAPFKGIHKLPDAWASLLGKSIPQAFERMVQAALDNQVDFVALAGDLFDQAGPSYYEYCLAMDAFKRLGEAGIPVYFAAGNHDPDEFWQRYYGAMPENVHVFPAGRDCGFFLHERDGEPLVLLAGRGYAQRFWPYGIDIAEGITRQAAVQAVGAEAPFAVGVLHAGLDIDPLKAPVSPDELLAAGMDYWALGHIHSRHLYGGDNPRIGFSGCLQGRAGKNTGPHGVNLVTLREGQPNQVEFVPTASIVWWKPVIDVSGCRTVAQVVDLAAAEIERLKGESQCGKLLVRFTLQGETYLHAQLRDPAVLEQLRAQVNAIDADVYCEWIADGACLPLSQDSLVKQGLFAAAYLQECDRLALNRPQEVSTLQEELMGRGVDPMPMTASDLDDWEQLARNLVLDALCEGRGGNDGR